MAQVTSSPVVATQKLVAIADLKDIQPAGPPTVQTTLETRVNGSGDTPASELPTLSSGPSTETSSTLPLLALAGAAGLVTSMAMAGALALAALGALAAGGALLSLPLLVALRASTVLTRLLLTGNALSLLF